MSDDPGTPAYDWAVTADPDMLLVQLPPVTGDSDHGPRDALRQLFRLRGFAPVGEDDDPAEVAAPASGCAVVPRDDGAVLVVSISERVGVTQVPVPHGDAAWAERTREAGSVVVLLTEAAVSDHAVTADGLRRDVAAGGVSAALVPVGEL